MVHITENWGNVFKTLLIICETFNNLSNKQQIDYSEHLDNAQAQINEIADISAQQSEGLDSTSFEENFEFKTTSSNYSETEIYAIEDKNESELDNEFISENPNLETNSVELYTVVTRSKSKKSWSYRTKSHKN